MSNTEIEKRLAVLEDEVALLKEKLGQEKKPEKAWWEKRAGMFADDPIYDEAMRLGREYRLAQIEDYDKDDDGEDNE